MVGVNNGESDGEVIAVAIKSVISTGLENFKIDLGNVRFLSGILEELRLDKDSCKKIGEMVEKRNYIGVSKYVEDKNIAENVEKILQ